MVRVPENGFWGFDKGCSGRIEGSEVRYRVRGPERGFRVFLKGYIGRIEGSAVR
jgi:hypothetical protein